MPTIAIEARNICKSYHVYDTPMARVRHALWPRATGSDVQQIHALNDVSFDVYKGESVGIIGKNGSGKSTLLEIITGTLKPTSGSVAVIGRVAALLELGSGFNPEYSGTENVFLNGLLMGLDRATIENKFDNIAGFADIGNVLDRPVKTYSSGMLVRLAFSVQVALQPDILIVDEALSVGDYFFQQKCFGRLRQMREDGLTLLFVSHDMGTVRDMCSRAILLASGRNLFIGDSKMAIQKYLSQTEEGLVLRGKISVQQEDEIFSSYVVDDFIEKFKSDAIWTNDGNEKVFYAIRLLNENYEAQSNFLIGDTLVAQILFSSYLDCPGDIGFTVKNKYDQIITNTGSYQLDIPIDGQPDLRVLELRFQLLIEAGQYSIMASFAKSAIGNRADLLENTEWFGPISIFWDYENQKAKFLGMFGLPVSGKLMMVQNNDIFTHQG
jgi:lipopolysaccharide transport system ATP-binding protein